MARRTTPLSATEVKTAKPHEKKYKLSDGNGLSMLILPNGSKLWRFKYRFAGKEKEYAIGVYPDISLAKAREEREYLRGLVASGIDPQEEKKQKIQSVRREESKKENTFYNVSQKWLEHYGKQVGETTHKKDTNRLKNHIYPTIKHIPIDDVEKSSIIAILMKLEEQGLKETARRVYAIFGKVYRYAVTRDIAAHNIAADIDSLEIIGKKEEVHYPTLKKEKDIKGLLLSIEDYTGDYSTKMAMRFLPYTFLRSFNVRYLEWTEVDFDKEEIRIPGEKMKGGIEFILPLPHQAIAILKEAQENCVSEKYVFPSYRSDDKPLSENTLISALRRMGYTKDQIVPHGFRAMFKTIAKENQYGDEGHGFDGDISEALLAHKISDAVIAAYNRAEYKDPKRALMQWYADHLDKIKEL